MQDFILGVIKGILIVVVPIAILLGFGVIGLAWPWLKYIVYGLGGLVGGFILWTILLIALFPEIRKHDLGWPLTYGYVWRKIWPFSKKYGTASNRKFQRRHEKARRLERNRNVGLFLMIFGAIAGLILSLYLVFVQEVYLKWPLVPSILVLALVSVITLWLWSHVINKLITIGEGDAKPYEFEILDMDNDGRPVLTEEGEHRIKAIKNNEKNRQTYIFMSLVFLLVVSLLIGAWITY